MEYETTKLYQQLFYLYFAGYTPSGEVDAINVTADSNNPADINIGYTVINKTVL